MVVGIVRDEIDEVPRFSRSRVLMVTVVAPESRPFSAVSNHWVRGGVGAGAPVFVTGCDWTAIGGTPSAAKGLAGRNER